ncbi:MULTISPECIES: SPOR domain-containing protein [Streptomyces]|uniref:SPOR domain-containing protein n=1 Tax=Streptomyces lichenis TaxID=2306967 RepID=A0ABT0IEP3_9ACTN|nr:SPOR domain-containing protein [Streptomyces lichenis]MCK8679805.1 SPOR domain-containing protein [Streptomyces lichenis]
MSEGSTILPWLVIRQDGNGNHYRVGRCATRDEAQKLADSLADTGQDRRYCVERIGRPVG